MIIQVESNNNIRYLMNLSIFYNNIILVHIVLNKNNNIIFLNIIICKINTNVTHNIIHNGMYKDIFYCQLKIHFILNGNFKYLSIYACV